MKVLDEGEGLRDAELVGIFFSWLLLLWGGEISAYWSELVGKR